MGEKADEIISSIKKLLIEGPKSISEIADGSKINWRTAESYLNLLKDLGVVYEKEMKNTRIFFYRDKNNYFEIPITYKDHKIISTMYYYIKKSCVSLFKKEPTKTQVYKIMWNINKNLPIGWYMYGPCCVQVYQGNESKEIELNKATISLIEKTAKDYCPLNNISLQRKVYLEAGKKLYLVKEELLIKNPNKKEELNLLLMDLIKHSPTETTETVTDFARASLLLGWEKMRECFDFLWRYIALVIFKQTLKDYYPFDLDLYLDPKIEEAKKEAQLYILNLVRSSVK